MFSPIITKLATINPRYFSYGFTDILGVYPVKKVRLLGGGGIAVYPMNFDGEINDVFINGRDTVLGGHVLAGFHWYLRPSGFVGMEGKYLFIERAKFSILQSS